MKTRAGGWFALHVMNPLDKRLMKWSNGKLSTAVGTDVSENAVLLRCTGAKSGKTRDVPLIATPFDDGWALIASATGVEKNPAWYHNLKAHPQCSMIANAQYSGYDVYQERTDRRIPVMVLVPSS